MTSNLLNVLQRVPDPRQPRVGAGDRAVRLLRGVHREGRRGDLAARLQRKSHMSLTAVQRVIHSAPVEHGVGCLRHSARAHQISRHSPRDPGADTGDVTPRPALPLSPQGGVRQVVVPSHLAPGAVTAARHRDGAAQRTLILLPTMFQHASLVSCARTGLRLPARRGAGGG